ncbi:MAG: hypothetical protein GXO19_03995 [Epsilonproteobacteria bacterium]|nr:hypothetical protein [Campylobacterota bacterium]NPA56883.1 hypothetical protein [Campylobacterota bacterium]
MREKSLKLFLKALTIEIEEIGTALREARERVEEYRKERERLKEEIQRREENPPQIAMELIHHRNFIGEQFQRIRELDRAITAEEERIQEIEGRLKERYGKREGLEKLLQKIELERYKRRMRQEKRIADESFARKFTTR